MSAERVRTFTVLDVSPLVLIMFYMCLFSSRGCSGAEGPGQSSGAVQTNPHAVRSLQTQTQRPRGRGGRAAVCQPGWSGLR